MMNEIILDKIQKADAKLDQARGFPSNDLQCYIETLLTTGQVEVGYRQQCGSTHRTLKVFREFRKIINLLKKDGHVITEEEVKHKNGYATINGGFWNSTIFKTNINAA